MPISAVGGILLERSEVHRAPSEGGDGVSILSLVPRAAEVPHDAFESVLDDVVIPWHSLASNRNYTPLWLSRGGMATKWWACLDSNQGLLLPKQQA